MKFATQLISVARGDQSLELMSYLMTFMFYLMDLNVVFSLTNKTCDKHSQKVLIGAKNENRRNNVFLKKDNSTRRKENNVWKYLYSNNINILNSNYLYLLAQIIITTLHKFEQAWESSLHKLLLLWNKNFVIYLWFWNLRNTFEEFYLTSEF